ncbi:unnamed protein product, partial [Prunus brigantina]
VLTSLSVSPPFSFIFSSLLCVYLLPPSSLSLSLSLSRPSYSPSTFFQAKSPSFVPLNQFRVPLYLLQDDMVKGLPYKKRQ